MADLDDFFAKKSKKKKSKNSKKTSEKSEGSEDKLVQLTVNNTQDEVINNCGNVLDNNTIGSLCTCTYTIYTPNIV